MLAGIMAVPLFLFGANHVKTDVPAAINVARERHPELEIRFGAPFGVTPEVLEVVDERITELEAALPPLPREETAVLLVERGSSDPDANAGVFQMARLLWEGRGFGWVETCFIGITRPDPGRRPGPLRHPGGAAGCWWCPTSCSPVCWFAGSSEWSRLGASATPRSSWRSAAISAATRVWSNWPSAG